MYVFGRFEHTHVYIIIHVEIQQIDEKILQLLPRAFSLVQYMQSMH